MNPALRVSANLYSDVPSWVQREICNPADEGGRHNQMIRIAPAIIRRGFNADDLHNVFHEMYGGKITWGEVDNVARSAAKYAQIPVQYAVNRDRAHLLQLTCQAQRDLPLVLKKYHWPKAEITQPISEQPANAQTTEFLRTLFRPDDIVWIGAPYYSGRRRYAACFRPVDEWLNCNRRIGEFCSQSTFKPGSYARSKDSLAKRKYFVVESDKLRHDEIGAVFQWLRISGLELRAVVDSGKRSLHGWFTYPGDEFVEKWTAIITGLNCDPATTRPTQPVRLPGAVRISTKQLQTLLYLQ